jgi:hypothetical protein
LRANTTANDNTAAGCGAMRDNTTGEMNSVLGASTLMLNTTGSRNTASGWNALVTNTIGEDNVAMGLQSLGSNRTGSRNIAIGAGAGANQVDGDDNIYVGSRGAVYPESGVTRIGTEGAQTMTFLAGVFGVTPPPGSAVGVVVTADGQLGTLSSSRRYKEAIQDMGEASDGLMRLRPVSKPIDYGLIAEEEAEVYPDLVVYSGSGEPETVQYHKLGPMILNELQKQQRILEERAAEIAELRARLSRLEEPARRP